MGIAIFLIGLIGWHVGMYGMFKRQELLLGKPLCHFIIPGKLFGSPILKDSGSGCN